MMPSAAFSKNYTTYNCSPAEFSLKEGGCECRDCNNQSCLAYKLSGTIKTSKQGSRVNLVLKKKDAVKTEMSLVISPPGLFKDYGPKDVHFSEGVFVSNESKPADLVEFTVSSYEKIAIEKIICEKKKEIVE